MEAPEEVDAKEQYFSLFLWQFLIPKSVSHGVIIIIIIIIINITYVAFSQGLWPFIVNVTHPYAEHYIPCTVTSRTERNFKLL